VSRSEFARRVDELICVNPQPRAGAGEVLVRVAFAGVNPADCKWRRRAPCVRVIDVMTFNAAGEFTSMRAFWGAGRRARCLRPRTDLLRRGRG
jgi:hypothetical protein